MTTFFFFFLSFNFQYPFFKYPNYNIFNTTLITFLDLNKIVQLTYILVWREYINLYLNDTSFFFLLKKMIFIQINKVNKIQQHSQHV